MQYVKPLPTGLIQRYRGWQATEYEDNKSWYKHLADLGQHPRSMVISCCDSRVHVTAIFGADQGEFFIHRNIANLVPPYRPDGDHHGTSAAVEYAVKALNVAHILVLGHSNCGGVKGCLDMCADDGHDQGSEFSFVSKWLEILSPSYPSIADVDDPAEKLRAFEHAAVRSSLANLMTFPFVSEAVNSEKLSLHGLWHDIGYGKIWALDPAHGEFRML